MKKIETLNGDVVDVIEFVDDSGTKITISYQSQPTKLIVKSRKYFVEEWSPPIVPSAIKIHNK